MIDPGLLLPSRLIAGDSIALSGSVDDYPASAWTLTYRLVPRDSTLSPQSFAATASGDEYDVAVTGTTTAPWEAGAYSWAAYVTSGANRHTVASGQTQILPDPALSDEGTDTRSSARIGLDAITAVLQGRASQSQLEYQIKDRMLKHIPHKDLIALYNFYKLEVKREDIAAGGRDSSISYVRFNRR